MPEQSHTPASRRFLPATSSSRTQHSASVRRAPFAHPSQPTSSSPFIRTPISLQKARQDDIETSFEDDAQPITTQDQHREKGHLRGHDLIEDSTHDGDVDQQVRGSDPFEIADYDDDLERPSRSDGRGATESSRANFSSPLAKRQKTSHFRQTSKTVIELSSSPSPSGNLDITDEPISRTEEGPALHEGQLSSEDTRLSDHDHDQVTNKKRFQPNPKPDSNITGEPERQATRKPFKGLSAGGGAPWMEDPLPATFSPSKRKGKHEYAYGGAADTVRSWILDMANEQSKTTTTSDHYNVDLETTFVDSSGRFEVARDNKSQEWLLVRQDDHIETVKQVTARTRGRAGGGGGVRSIVVKGKGTTWDLHADQTPQQTSNPPKNVRVAVLWNNKVAK